MQRKSLDLPDETRTIPHRDRRAPGLGTHLELTPPRAPGLGTHLELTPPRTA